MKALFLGLGLLLSSWTLTASAAELKSAPWRVDLFPLNLELRYERDSAQQMVDRRPLNFAVGVRRSSSTVLLEYSSFSEQTGNATLSILRDHREYSLWWKENLMNFEFVDLFASGGLGGYEEKVTTTLANSGRSTDSSGLQLLGGASVGIQSMAFRYILLSLEGRLIAGKNFDPNPQTSLLIRAGLEF